MTMKMRKFSIADATLERSPGQSADVFVGNLVDERLEGRLSVSTATGTVTGGMARSSICPEVKLWRSDLTKKER
jgi:ethanolamine utilization protein EutQ (cupin superfamily)